MLLDPFPKFYTRKNKKPDLGQGSSALSLIQVVEDRQQLKCQGGCEHSYENRRKRTIRASRICLPPYILPLKFHKICRVPLTEFLEDQSNFHSSPAVATSGAAVGSEEVAALLKKRGVGAKGAAKGDPVVEDIPPLLEQGGKLEGGISSGYEKLIVEGVGDDTYLSDTAALIRISGTSLHDSKTVQVDQVRPLGSERRQIGWESACVPIKSKNVVQEATYSRPRLPLHQVLASRNKCPKRRPHDQSEGADCADLNDRSTPLKKQALDVIHRRKIREEQTSEERDMERTINTAKRKLARRLQSEAEKDVVREQDKIRRRISLANNRMQDDNAKLFPKSEILVQGATHNRPHLPLHQVLASRNKCPKRRHQDQSEDVDWTDLNDRSTQLEEQTLDDICRRKFREEHTSEERDVERTINTAKRKLARQLQSEAQKDVVREQDKIRRRISRANKRVQDDNAKLFPKSEIVVQGAMHSRPHLPLHQVLASRNKCPKRRCQDHSEGAQSHEEKTSDDLDIERAINTAKKKLARHLQSEVEKEVVREQDKIRRRISRANNRIQEDNAKLFRRSCQDFVWVHCPQCKRAFPELKLSGDICTICSREKGSLGTHKFSADNLMDPGTIPFQLSRLSELERLLIARIHPMMSLYRVKGQQFKYSGNVINFVQPVNEVAEKLPCKPADLSAILVVKRTHKFATKEFRVRREFIRQALVWLSDNHQHYRDIIIDREALETLPIDGIPEDIPQASESGKNGESGTLDVEEDDVDGPPERDNDHIVHVDGFQVVGTMDIMPQPDQQKCIRRTLQVETVDETVVHMSFPNTVIDEFSTPGYITMAFPVLFPYGTADLREGRMINVEPLEYFQYLMMYFDGRFARDPRFRYFAWNSLSRWRALALGDVYVKKNPRDADLSIQEIRQMVAYGNKQLATRISYFAKNIRGSRAYWFTRLQELVAMVKQLGPPTIFFTLSAADLQWPELYKLLDPSNELSRLSTIEQRKARARLLNDNPLVVAWFLQKRVDVFFQDFLKSEFCVIDHWYRFEWQNRGSGHVHGFLWLKDAPDVTKITDEHEKLKIIEYFDRLVCTVNPDPSLSVPMDDHPCARMVDIDASLDVDDADYARLVNWVMRHSKCGTYCLRPHKTTKKMVCRFKYPFDVLDKSHVVEDPPDSGMYRFMGHHNDSYVCSHNRRVLQTWRANIDWSPILSLLTVVNYIGKYAAKAEPASKNFTNALQEILEDLLRPCQNAKSVVKKLLMRSVCERDFSAQEVCHLLMGYALCRSSRRIVLLNVSENSLLASIIRRSRDENDEDIVGTDPSFVCRYLERPSEHDKRSLLHMAMKHYYAAGCWHKYQVDAVVRVVPQIDGNITENSEKWEVFCRQQVLLHHHYRSLEEAKGGFKDWSQQYSNLGLQEKNFCMVPDPLDDDIDDVDAAFDPEDAMWEEWMMAASMHPMFDSGVGVKLGFRDIDTSYDWSKGLDRYPNIEIEKKFIQNHLRGCQNLDDVIPTSTHVQLDQLSNEQLAAHDYVIKSLQNETPIKLIVCGGAGTGKSTLVNSIVQSVTERFGKHSVHIMAPTGVAAFNIGGATIHHELAINPEQRPSQPYKPLSNEQCQRMQESFKGTKLIIIDEYSMVGRAMLSNIDLRCRDIFSVDAPFGNVSVVLVGDMRQLNPVFDSPLYVKGGTQMQRCGGITYAGFEKCVRLSQIFRQVGDEQATFRDALQRLSDGSSTEADWHLFKRRDASTLGKKDMETFRNALRLFPTRKKADEYNLERLLDLKKPVAHIPSNNNCEAASNALQEEAKGLEKVVCLAIGARVMLRSNLSTQYGLVNGAMGTVDDIVYAPDCDSKTDMPLAVMVNFDNYSGPKLYGDTNIIPISPQTSHWKSSSGTSCQRTQMPIILCWAITIHKSQGLTLDRVVVDIGQKESLGLTFVALSRTRKLCDLAFSPMFTYERLNKIKACRGLSWRLEEEKRLCLMSKMEKYD